MRKGDAVVKITNKNIDAGNAFDWGRTSKDYAKYRDIYPSVFYEKIAERGLCVANQRVLDLGTGTGVLPRNMYTYGANWTGTDISQQQIEEAKALARQMNQNISYFCVSAEDISFTSHTFDVITACQCFWYFDYLFLLTCYCNKAMIDEKRTQSKSHDLYFTCDRFYLYLFSKAIVQCTFLFYNIIEICYNLEDI